MVFKENIVVCLVFNVEILVSIDGSSLILNIDRDLLACLKTGDLIECNSVTNGLVAVFVCSRLNQLAEIYYIGNRDLVLYCAAGILATDVSFYLGLTFVILVGKCCS